MPQLQKLRVSDVRGQVDFAILTVREDEEEAVRYHFRPYAQVQSDDDDDDGAWTYSLSRVSVPNGYYHVATLRLLHTGSTNAQHAASDVIRDLCPKWLLSVGTGGGLPSTRYTLGDVVLTSRIHDFSVSAALENGRVAFDLAGGSVSVEVGRLLASVGTFAKKFTGWNTLRMLRGPRPSVDLTKLHFEEATPFKTSALSSLQHHFSSTVRQRSPRVVVGYTLSGSELIRDPQRVAAQLDIARHIASIDMESAGIFEAARGSGPSHSDVPMLNVRGVSDVVGVTRTDEWLSYACRSAAAFVKALVQRGDILEPRRDQTTSAVSSRVLSDQHVTPLSARPGPNQFPADIEQHFDRIADNLRVATARFSENERQRALMAKHLSTLSRNLEKDSELLRSGHIVRDYDDCSLLTACIDELSAGDEVLGLTDWQSDRDWWHSADAQRFLEANARAVDRGATIRRIFVCDHDADDVDYSGHLFDEMQRHARIGVAVCSLARAQLPLRMPELRSQCVIKSKDLMARPESWLTYRVEHDARGQPTRNILSIQADDIKSNEQYLATLWSCGTPFPRHALTAPASRPVDLNADNTEPGCGQVQFGACEAPTDHISPAQFVPAGLNDGRRLYIHTASFDSLARQSREAAHAIYSGLVAVPVVKLVHHDLAEDGVGTGRIRKDVAEALHSAISQRWFDKLTMSLRRIGAVPDSPDRRKAFLPLLDRDERIVATCLDADYYTFATSENAALRMFSDFTKLRKVRQAVMQRTDAYRDLTMIKGRALALIDPSFGTGDGLAHKYQSRMSPTIHPEDLDALKQEILTAFHLELKRVIAKTVTSASLAEWATLRRFEAKCIGITRDYVLRLKEPHVPS